MTQSQHKTLNLALRRAAIRAGELRKELSVYENYALTNSIDADPRGKEAVACIGEALSLLKEARETLVSARDKLSQVLS